MSKIPLYTEATINDDTLFFGTDGDTLLQHNYPADKVDDYVKSKRTLTVPSTAGSTGTPGDIRFDANYAYFCTAINTWKRVAISTWT